MSIDHIVVTAQSLADGIAFIEETLGLKPIIGGRHPKWGTENALLSLGQCYLEVVAPDPKSAIAPSETWIGSFLESSPKLSTWVLKTNEIVQTRSNALNAGIDIGEIQRGNRKLPDGGLLEWELTDPYTMPFDGILPFLINWGNSPHPSQTTPLAGQLKELILYHPQAEAVSRCLKSLDLNMQVNISSKPSLEAIIETPNGMISIR